MASLRWSRRRVALLAAALAALAAGLWCLRGCRPGPSPERGREVFTGKGRCWICHSTDPQVEPRRCPNLATIGRDAASRNKGSTATEYILQSIVDPTAYTVKDFPYGYMPRINRETIFLEPDEIRSLVLYLQSLGGTADAQQVAAAEQTIEIPLPQRPHEPPLPGDPAAGRAAYMSPQIGCIGCHRIGSEGGDVGPEHTFLGLIQSASQIRQSIVEPNAILTVGYRQWIFRLRTAPGIVVGMPRHRTDTTVELVDANRNRVTLRRSDIVSEQPDPLSAMPNGFGDLDDHTLDNLVAFLKSQTGGK